MTSQLNVDTIVDKAGSGGTNVKVANTSTYVSDGGNVTQNTVQGIAKVWSNNNTGTANDSLNQSGLTDNGTGDFTISFSNAMSSIYYSSTLGGADANTNAAVLIMNNNGNGYATGSINYFLANEDSGATDYGPMSTTIHGDLA